MNRIIKFRAKRIDTGEWVYGFYMSIAGTHKILSANADSASGATYYDVDASTVGQYTGLSDITGREIYEDDIYRLEFYGENKPIEFASFNNGRFVTIDPEKPYRDESLCTFVKYMRVLGNIHDNPKLLQQ